MRGYVFVSLSSYKGRIAAVTSCCSAVPSKRNMFQHPIIVPTNAGECSSLKKMTESTIDVPVVIVNKKSKRRSIQPAGSSFKNVNTKAQTAPITVHANIDHFLVCSVFEMNAINGEQIVHAIDVIEI